MIWDAENNRPLCKFDRKGILETNDETLAEKLKAMGYVVTGEVDKIESEILDFDGKLDIPDSEGVEIPEGGTREQNAEGESDAGNTNATSKLRRTRK